MTTPFDKYWVEKHGGPPEPGQHGMFEEAKRAWDAALETVRPRLNSHEVRLNEISQRVDKVQQENAEIREMEAKLRIQLTAVLVERDEAVSSEQRAKAKEAGAVKQCERLHKRLQKMGWVADGGKTGPRATTLFDIAAEVVRARKKFPSREHLLAALGEEYGEVCKAYLENQGKDRVYSEAKQVACVAIRIMEEGDSDFDE